MATKTSKPSRQQQAAKARRQEKEVIAAEDRKRKDERRNLGIKIAAGVFAALMGLSMLLPSLSAFFADSSSNTASMSNVSVAGLTSVAEIDEAYAATTADLEGRLANGENKTVLVTLANDYVNWANAAGTYATTDEEKLHVSDLYESAVGYFDRYLAIDDDDDVAARRALAEYYAGNVAEAAEYLEERLGTNGTHAPSWVYLGMFREAQGNTEAAMMAYLKASEVDPENNYGLRDYITGRIAALNGETTAAAGPETALSGN